MELTKKQLDQLKLTNLLRLVAYKEAAPQRIEAAVQQLAAKFNSQEVRRG